MSGNNGIPEIDRTAFSVTGLNESDEDRYWRSRPPSQRLEAVEVNRRIVRIGVPPIRIAIHTTLSGVEFAPCYERRRRTYLGGIEVSLLALPDLKANKRASGRHKDLDDLEHLPEDGG